ncbi:MAG: hypothetical protein ACT4OL_03760 [Nitrospiraceae bacterium]
MRSFQIFVALVLIVSMVTISTANAQPVEALAIVDATGKTLGPVLDATGAFYKVPHVPFTINNSTFVLAVFKTKFGGSGIPTYLYFSSRRCNHQTGQVVASMSDMKNIDVTFWSFVAADGSTVYVPTANAQPIQSFKSLSRLLAEPNGDVVCDDFAQFVPTGIPATPLVNMLTLFTPPFAVEGVTKKGMGSSK